MFSDEVPDERFSLKETSILGFYNTVTFALGVISRRNMVTKAYAIFLNEARDPEKIRNLMVCIFRVRLELYLKFEEEL